MFSCLHCSIYMILHFHHGYLHQPKLLLFCQTPHSFRWPRNIYTIFKTGTSNEIVQNLKILSQYKVYLVSLVAIVERTNFQIDWFHMEKQCYKCGKVYFTWWIWHRHSKAMFNKDIDPLMNKYNVNVGISLLGFYLKKRL